MDLDGIFNAVMIEEFCITSAASSHVGRKRSNNEDSYIVWEPKDRDILLQKGRLYAIADGMGGRAAGEVASQLAIQVLINEYVKHPGTVPEALAYAVLQAHHSVLNKARADASLNGMGTTLTAMALIDGVACFAHVGDSRAYLIRKNTIRQKTSDHSVEMITNRDEVITKGVKPRIRRALTQAIGGQNAPRVEVTVFPLQDGDKILLCSDGLYSVVEDEIILQIAAQKRPDWAVLKLIDLANEQGGPDNVTVLIIKIKRPWLRALIGSR
ncbi:MAG: PP2C family protein-serine/threonine phosphatase [Ignavibacteriales bacterium]